MSGLFLTMVCMVLGVLVLTMGPLSAESSRIGGINIDYQMKKRSCSQEEGVAALEQCGGDRRCIERVDRAIARNCGAKKRAFDFDRGDSEETVSAGRGQSHPPGGLHRIRFSKRMDWR